MRKTITMAAAVLLMVCLLAGCGNGDGPVALKLYGSVQEATDALGFTPLLPAAAPEGYNKEEVSVLNEAILEVKYLNDAKDVVSIRAAKTDAGDISGDSNAYSYSEEVPQEGYSVTLRGMGELAIHSALWTNGDYQYALFFQQGKSVPDVLAYIATMQ